jgi:T-complex protein 1 subunit beta
MAIEAFARALRQIPTIIADNAGLDGTELVSQLRAAHHKGQNTMGLDIENGSVGDITDLAVTESFQVKSKVLLSAAEAAEMILRVDEIIRSAPRFAFPLFSSTP